MYNTRMSLNIFNNVSSQEKSSSIESIIKHSTPGQDFFLMVILSVSMASFGVLLDSTVILIGSMLIAPVLYPTISLALALVTADDKLIFRSLVTLAKSVGFALLAGFIIGIFFGSGEAGTNYTIDIIAGSKPSLLYAVVAAISGLAASFAVIKPNLNETLPGVAISVSLVPPLATAGVAIAKFNWVAISNSLILFLVNIAGIVFSGMVVFSLFRLAGKKNIVSEVVKEEDKKIESEISHGDN